MSATDLQKECIEVCQELVRFNTVNPPGGERARHDRVRGVVPAHGVHGHHRRPGGSDRDGRFDRIARRRRER